MMLQLSLQPGKYSNHLQFASVRKFRSAFSNAYQASVEGQQAMVMAKDTRKLAVTKCPTYGEFFERFMRGLHKRMGDIVKQDKVLAQPILKVIFMHLEIEWNDINSSKFSLAMEGSFYVLFL